jgi:hypothetical protein
MVLSSSAHDDHAYAYAPQRRSVAVPSTSRLLLLYAIIIVTLQQWCSMVSGQVSLLDMSKRNCDLSCDMASTPSEALV